MFEPYALKGARTVLRRGKLEKVYLFQPQIHASINLVVYESRFAQCH